MSRLAWVSRIEKASSFQTLKPRSQGFSDRNYCEGGHAVVTSLQHQPRMSRMTIDQLKPNMVLRGPIFSEPFHLMRDQGAPSPSSLCRDKEPGFSIPDTNGTSPFST